MRILRAVEGHASHSGGTLSPRRGPAWRARGHGIGSRLIDECVRFAKQAGYRKITLWTQSELDAAGRLYKKAGFTRTTTNPHDSFGRKGLVSETWECRLTGRIRSDQVGSGPIGSDRVGSGRIGSDQV